MILTILGSGTSVIRPDRHAPSFLVTAGRKLLLFDCGWGAGENLIRAGYKISDIDHIFISHPHADHISDLVPILHHILNYGQFFPANRRTKPLYLHGYKGFKKDYETLRTITFPERVEKYKILVSEYANTAKLVNNIRVKTRVVPHVPHHFHSVAFRVETGGKKIFYSGDSGFSEILIELAKGADIAICEMSISPRMFSELGARPNHLSAFECGVIAKRAKAKKLVLMHLYDNASAAEIKSEVRKSFGGPVVISKDLQKIEF